MKPFFSIMALALAIRSSRLSLVFCGTWMLVTLMLYAHNYWGMWHGRTEGTLTVEPKGQKTEPQPFKPDPEDPTLHDYC